MRRPLRLLALLALVALVASLAGCPQPPVVATPTPTLPVATSPTPRPTATSPEQALGPLQKPIELLDDGDVASLRQALQESKQWYRRQPAAKTLIFGTARTVTMAEMAEGMQRAQDLLLDNPTPAQLSTRMAENFDFYEATYDTAGKLLVTGYYEPLIEAAASKGHGYTTPIYGSPDDTIIVDDLSIFDAKLPPGRHLIGRLEGRHLVPYWKRTEIDSGKLGSHSRVLAWARDPVDLYFVQVQGSSSVRFPDKSEKRIGYVSDNGFHLHSPANKMIDMGDIPRAKMSMQAMRAWFDAHPAQTKEMLEYDDSFVFFRWLDGAPEGFLGFPVTPGRSIAVDRRLMPHGALAFIDTTMPVPLTTTSAAAAAVSTSSASYATAPLRRFVLAQDTGGAIKGAGHVDFFWGKGPDAVFRAGYMKQPGRVVFLAPKRKPAP